MKGSFAASMFKQLAKRAGVKVNIEPRYAFVARSSRAQEPTATFLLPLLI